MKHTMQYDEKIIKKGVFHRIAYSSAKKRTCEKGELVLTTKNLLINCEGSWTKAFPIREYIRLEAWDDNLEVYDGYARLRFRLIIDEPNQWKEALNKLTFERLSELFKRLFEDEEKRPMELKKLLDMSPEALKKLYDNLKKERMQFERKNIRFILDIQISHWGSKDRKLRAFIVAHSYVAWYEWTKRLLSKIYKAKFGKGPTNDGELIEFLEDYPSWKGYLDTTEWGIKANQIRNCVSHEKFYFDYKNSKLVFMTKTEKRIRLREVQRMILSMSHFYGAVLDALRKKVTKTAPTKK
jgi:hypothetical protein